MATKQYQALRIIYLAKREMAVSEIGRIMKTSTKTAHDLITNLHRRSLIRKETRLTPIPKPFPFPHQKRTWVRIDPKYRERIGKIMQREFG